MFLFRTVDLRTSKLGHRAAGLDRVCVNNAVVTENSLVHTCDANAIVNVSDLRV